MQFAPELAGRRRMEWCDSAQLPAACALALQLAVKFAL